MEREFQGRMRMIDNISVTTYISKGFPDGYIPIRVRMRPEEVPNLPVAKFKAWYRESYCCIIDARTFLLHGVEFQVRVPD